MPISSSTRTAIHTWDSGVWGRTFCFFSLKEYGTPLDDFTNKLFDVYDQFQPFINFYEDNIEPVYDDLEEAVITADKVLFRNLFGDIERTADTISAALKTKVKGLVAQQFDPFYFYVPNVQKGTPESEWYWFDVLHSRRTGSFGTRLWEMATDEGDSDLQRYVLGYVSHIATDTVGHPFVNAVTGGPWRTHWHRHKLVENWIDAYARNHFPDGGLKTCLSLDREETYVGDSISGSHHYQLTKFRNGKLPDKLAEMFSDAMADTYDSMDQHPPFLDPADLDSAYRLWLKWFEKATTKGDAQAPNPVSPPGKKAARLVRNYVQGFPSHPKSGSTPSGRGGLTNVFGGILAFIDWLTDALAYTFKFIFNNADDIVTLPYHEAIQTLKWLLYQVRKYVWEVYDNARFALVLAGYVYPEPRDLKKNPWGKSLINTDYVHLTGGGRAQFAQYPLQEEAHDTSGPMEHHLIYPRTPEENLNTEPAPKPFYGAYPETFIDGVHPYNPNIEALYDCIEPYGSSSDATNYINSQTSGTAQLGSAVDFSARLIAQRIRQLPNFNLSGDRGYSWKTWVADDDTPLENDHQGTASDPIKVSYIDVR
jgi:hypothetical protein